MDISNPIVYNHEMNRYERGLIDACFEEGQYDMGIFLLNKLRLPKLGLSPSHVRQLIYMALLPPTEKDTKKDILNSPSKMPASRQPKLSLPTSATSLAAVHLLGSLANTVPLGHLMRAIPCYPLTKEESVLLSCDAMPSAPEDDHEDSLISKAAQIIKGCPDCWSMLRPDFIRRSSTSSNAPVTRRTRQQDGNDDEDDDIPDCPVGPNSWHVLNWLVTVFEKEEIVLSNRRIGTEEGKEVGIYSTSLFAQIKPSRTGSGPRAGVDVLLNILFSCYERDEKGLGQRLASLMINLTHIPSFSASDLVSATSIRLRSLEDPILLSFLELLPSHNPALAFKLAICDKYLSDYPKSSRFSAKTIPRRARPVHAFPKKSAVEGRNHSLVNSSHTPKINHPWIIPSASRVLSTLSLDMPFEDVTLSLFTVKFHLIMAFATLESSNLHKDKIWREALQDAGFEKRLLASFSWDTKEHGDERLGHSNPKANQDEEKSKKMKQTLLDLLPIWRRQLDS